MTLTWDDIENLRDRTFRRQKKLQVRTMAQALAFVKQTGFCFAFTARHSELPCLWHAACGERKPEYPEHTHSDPYIGLVWEAKDDLVAKRSIYYGKAIKQRPSMISLEFFPCFYRLFDRVDSSDYFYKDYMAGQLSPAAKRIMEALTERSPQVTAELKLCSGYGLPERRAEFDRGMAELQMKMYVVKIAEFYDPFTFLWELVSVRFSDEIAVSRGLSLSQARQRILEQYFRTLWVADPAAVQRLFGWPRPVVDDELASLISGGVIKPVTIKNEKRCHLGIFSL
jgi:hypothetical protein